MFSSYLTRLLLLLIAAVLVIGCTSTTSTPELVPPSPSDSAAYWPTQAWEASTPEQQGMDSETLAEMLELIEKSDYGMDSVVIVRNGFLVLDAKIYPFATFMDTKHNIFSCTKSVVSALIGIAIDEGYIEGVDQPLLDFFPDLSAANLSGGKQAMTLEHLLTMTTGLECRDSYLYDWDGLRLMMASDDWVQYMLDLPMIQAPGTRFEYCNGASFLLSAIIQETTGMPAINFAAEHLFTPLGIQEVGWDSNPQGINLGYGEMEMQPRDMAKIGYLYLNKGLWDGEQIVSTQWVEASTRQHIPATLQEGYGYQWWVDDSGIYMALGYGGQYIVVVPEKELVVVFVSDLAEVDFYLPDQLLHMYILPAAKSSRPLPENSQGVARLISSLNDLTRP